MKTKNEVLEFALNLLEDETKWCRFANGRNEKGESCGLREAKSFDFKGALLKSNCEFSLYSEICSEAREKTKVNLLYWNDNKETTFKDVISMLESLKS